MYSCLAELREICRDLSRRRHNLGNSRLVQGVMALVARAQGCRFETLACPTRTKAPASPRTTYSNVSVLTTCINHILLNPLFILLDYVMMWRTANV